MDRVGNWEVGEWIGWGSEQNGEWWRGGGRNMEG